jgi:catechol 2,3-dioxygenase-like lactoylglutathione lyase family enzyme
MGLKQYQVAGMIPAADPDRARKFYTEILGLEADKSAPDGADILLSADGTRIVIYPAPSAGKAAHTLVSWNVPDVRAEAASLKAKGVALEEYDMPDIGIKTIDGVATLPIGTAAWFKDTEGNILGLFGPPSAS